MGGSITGRPSVAPVSYGRTVFEPPRSLSPSSIASFTSCPLAFRYSYIERLPGPPSVHTSLGTLVHLALQHLMWRPRPERTRAHAMEDLIRARVELRDDPDLRDLDLSPVEWAAFHKRAVQLVNAYFAMEDPKSVDALGVELRLQAEINGVVIRGVIDRLDRASDGLVVVDYKTGRPPGESWEQSSMHGVNAYASMVEANLGVRPVRVELLYLASGERISCDPTGPAERMVAQRAAATWKAVLRACETGDFRPRPSKLCDWCNFQDLCPAYEPKIENEALATSQ